MFLARAIKGRAHFHPHPNATYTHF